MATTLVKNGLSDSTKWGDVDEKTMVKTRDDIFEDETLGEIKTLKHADAPELKYMAYLA